MVERKEQILPVRIGLFDQADLPGAFPFLDLVFAGLGTFARIMNLIPDQPRDAVSTGKRCALAFPVLPRPSGYIIRMPAIQRAVLLAGKQVNVKRHIPLRKTPRAGGVHGRYVSHAQEESAVHGYLPAQVSSYGVSEFLEAWALLWDWMACKSLTVVGRFSSSRRYLRRQVSIS